MGIKTIRHFLLNIGCITLRYNFDLRPLWSPMLKSPCFPRPLANFLAPLEEQGTHYIILVIEKKTCLSLKKNQDS